MQCPEPRARCAASPYARALSADEAAQVLGLRVTDGGNGTAHDHADRAGATVRCRP